MNDLASKTIEERREIWAQKLESGEYKQGKAALRSADNLFCCLGVACDLFDATQWKKDSEQPEEFRNYTYSKTQNGGMPPAEVRNFFGITGSEAPTLAAKNDGGHKFEDIAKIIREKKNA